MSDAKINLSLDEIIKNNRKTGGKKTGQPLGLAARKRQAALARRQKIQQKGAAMGRNRTPGGNIRGRGQVRAPQRAGQQRSLNTFATRKLVQSLVKKALVQSRVGGRGRGGRPSGLSRAPIHQRTQLTTTPIRRTVGRGRGGGVRGRVALRVGGRGRGIASTTGVKARLGFSPQKNNRLNAVNQRRGINLQLSTSRGRGRGRGRGGFGRLASDQIVQEQNAMRRQQQAIRQQRQIQQQQRALTTRGRGGRFASGGGFAPSPRIQLVSPSRRTQQQFVAPRGGRRGRGGMSFVNNAGRSGFGGGEVRGVRASFSNSQTGTTLNDRFGGGRQQVRVGLKQQRGRGGFRGRRQIIY